VDIRRLNNRWNYGFTGTAIKEVNFLNLTMHTNETIETFCMVQEAGVQNYEFLEETGCQSSRCLYDIPSEELLESVPNNWRTFLHDIPLLHEKSVEHNWIVLDESILRSYSKMDTKNQQNPLRFVAGSSMHIDANSELRGLQDWNNTGKFRQYLDERFGPHLTTEALQVYFRPDTNHWQQVASMISDYRTICPLLKFSSQFFSSDSTYFYVATQASRTSLGNLVPTHSDIQAILSTTVPKGYRERKFFEHMSSMFYNFVSSGSVLMENAAHQKIFLVDSRVTETDAYAKCNFWDRYRLMKKSQQINNLQNNASSVSV
jgi:hypothetical protein